MNEGHADPRSNMILAALPDGEYGELLPLLRRVPLETGQVLYEQDQRFTDVYFPLSGAVSMLIVLEDGRSYEPGIIGREGILGFPIGLGDDISRWRSVIQVPGEALVMSREALQDQLRGPGNLNALLMHYAGLLIALVGQSSACAQFHELKQSCCRWLLLMHDRAEGDEFTLTHEYLSQMLGAHRPTVTEVLHVLRDDGLIELRRGSIRILDRQGLEATVCECYHRIKIRYEESVEVAPRHSTGGGYPYESGQ